MAAVLSAPRPQLVRSATHDRRRASARHAVRHADLAGARAPSATARRTPSPRPAPAVAAAKPARHVFWRRRAVALVVAGVLLAGGWAVLRGLGGGSLVASGPAARASIAVVPVAARSHVVVPGDTLWSIARSLQPEGDVRNLVDQLSRARHGRPLQVGERIEVP